MAIGKSKSKDKATTSTARGSNEPLPNLDEEEQRKHEPWKLIFLKKKHN